MHKAAEILKVTLLLLRFRSLCALQMPSKIETPSIKLFILYALRFLVMS
jgi:hypothetical protein